jgi:hypothetical protein
MAKFFEGDVDFGAVACAGGGVRHERAASVRIEYTCKDGSRTLALWPTALLHTGWASRPARLRTRSHSSFRSSARRFPATITRCS